MNLPVWTGGARVRIRELPFSIKASSDDETSALCLIQNNTITSSLALYPDLIGGRFQELAHCFQQYRVRQCTVHYRSQTGVDGKLLDTAPTTTPSYMMNQFAIGFSADPVLTPTDAFSVVEQGGTLTQIGANVSYNYVDVNPKWLFVLPDSPNTVADLRQIAFGRLSAIWSIAPSANVAIALGNILLDLDVEFRYMAHSILSEAVVSKTNQRTEDESKKGDPDLAESLVLVSKRELDKWRK